MAAESHPTAVGRQTGVSFCVITNGYRRDRLTITLDSIRALDLPDREIIVVGAVPAGLGDDLQVLKASDLAADGRLGAMRNLGCRAARFDQLVVADDDMRFHPEFAQVLRDRDPDVDVLCVRLLNPDGTRHWDWATHGGPTGHRLMAYDETDPFVYVTGGLAIMWARVHDLIPWDDTRGFYQGEDLDWSARLRGAGMRIGFDVRGCVTHQDPRYTQMGHEMRFTQDLGGRERLAEDVEASGVFREGIPGVRGCRWMSGRGEIHAPPRSSERQFLRFVLTNMAPDLITSPFGVMAEVNGAAQGVLLFEGTQSIPLRVPLRDGAPTVVRLTSERGVTAAAVGIDDPRPVSILIHDAALTVD